VAVLEQEATVPPDDRVDPRQRRDGGARVVDDGQQPPLVARSRLRQRPGFAGVAEVDCGGDVLPDVAGGRRPRRRRPARSPARAQEERRDKQDGDAGHDEQGRGTYPFPEAAVRGSAVASMRRTVDPESE
jgi:hypothetical protein